MIAATNSEIMDYTNYDFFIYKDTKDILIYESYADLFHITNLSLYKHIIQLESTHLTTNNKNLQWEIAYDLDVIKILLSQILPNRAKRGINELGTIWKWIAGTPDHDDFITVQNKIDDLIQNNNNQFVINSKLFNEIKSLSNNLQTVLSNQELPLRKHRLRLLTYDLMNLMDTITLAKIDVFNTKILNAEDIQEIYKHEHKPVVITDILDISKFKIAIHQELIIIYIKYPIITNRCQVYNARSISHDDGKLLIDKQVAKCSDKYYVISNFKTELFNNYGTLRSDSTCFTRLLNGEKSLCNKIREHNKNIDVIQEGAIFINGHNIVNDTHLYGSFLITFNSTTIINNISYTNLDHKIIEYITAKQYNDFLISEYLMSNDSELSFDNINMLNPLIQIKHTQIPVSLILILLTLLYLIISLLIKFRKYLICKPREIQIETNPENNLSENANTTEDEIIVELTNHLNSVYPSLPMNRDDPI